MNIRITLYFLASFFLTFASGARDGLTSAGWVALVAFSLGSGVTAAIAYLDRSSGTPSQLATAKTVVAIVAILLAIGLAGCITIDATMRLKDGVKIRAGTNGTGGSIELSREF